ncbi:hypothetical protein [Sutcliffiella horikoshii]|uniref:hypothetical protein n=1 Tax=Sutcliffiella horikoshii TaxID=79883 RepID=UPI001CFD86F2|nr:hypothetical protein [Sutcliffiella horikoshii]
MERLGSDELHTIINIIERLQMSDIVKKAQFKGYPALTYTLMKEGDSDKYIIPIAFQLVGENRQIIRIITISFKDAPPKALEHRLNTDLEMVIKMELFKKRLVEKYNQKKR